MEILVKFWPIAAVLGWLLLVWLGVDFYVYRKYTGTWNPPSITGWEHLTQKNWEQIGNKKNKNPATVRCGGGSGDSYSGS